METKNCIVNKPMAAILRVSRLFCVAPLRFVPLRNSFSISTSREYAIIGHTIIGLYITFDICSNIYIETMIKERHIRVRSWLSLFYLSAQVLTTVTTLGVISMTGIKRMHHIFNYLNVLKKLNEELGSNYLDLKMKHSEPLVCSYLFVIIFVGAADFYSTMDEITLDFNGSFVLFSYLSVYVENLFIILIQMQIIFIIYIIYATLRKMNGRLRSLHEQKRIFRSVPTDIYISANSFPDVNMARRFRDTYMAISELVREVNKNEGIILFLILSFNIMDITDEVYIIISENSTPENSVLGIPLSLNCILSVIWCVYGIACIIILVEPCHWVHQELQNTQDEVSHLLLNWNQRQLTEEFDDFINQVIYNVPAFSVLEICDFSRQLVIAILGGICTILLMMKQFNLKDEVPS